MTIVQCPDELARRGRAVVTSAAVGAAPNPSAETRMTGEGALPTSTQPGLADHPRRIAMQVVEGFTLAEIADFARRTLAPSCEVISDGLNCFHGVIEAGCSHSVHITGGGRRAAEAPVFKWVSTALGNIKFALTGTYRHHHSKHSPRYLAEFQYRFNRRFDLAGMLTRLAYVSVRTSPAPYDLLTVAESRA